MKNDIEFVTPNWFAPANVHAAVTTRIGGESRAPYDSLNLAIHVGDNPATVQANRDHLRNAMALPAEPRWLRQVHGNTVVDVAATQGEPEADGAWATKAGIVCAVLTADCLPILLCDRAGTRVAALHAGWRGLAAGVIEQGVAALAVPGSEIMAWLGPAIGPEAFEVGAEVRTAFLAQDPSVGAAFRMQSSGKYLADIYQLARRRLAALDVTSITGGDFCTVQDRRRFYSYRRDGVTGRMASLVWLSND